MTPRRRAFLALPLLLLSAAPSRADTFVLRDGTSLEGQVLRTFEDDARAVDRWEIRTLKGRRTLLASEVREVRERRASDPPYPWVVFEREFLLVNPDDAEALYALGAGARAAGMEAEAARAFRRAIAASPDHPRARTALGFVKVDGKWVLPPGKAVAPEDRGEPVAGEPASPLEGALGRAFARRRSENYRVESSWLDQPGLGRMLDTLESVRDAVLAYLGESTAPGTRPATYLLLRDAEEYRRAVDTLVAPALDARPDREDAQRTLRLYRNGHLAILPPPAAGCIAWRTSEEEVEDRAFLAHFAVHEAWDSETPREAREPDWLREAVAYAVLNDLFPDDPTWCVATGYGRGARLPPAWRNTRSWGAAARGLATSGKALSFHDLASLDLNSLTYDALVQSWSVLQVLRAKDEAGTRAFLRRVRRGGEQFQVLKETLHLEAAGVDALWRTEVLKRR